MLFDKIIFKLDKKLDRLYAWISTEKLAREKASWIKKRVKLIHGGYRGTSKEYKDTVIAYWKKYGLKPKRFWFANYCNGLVAYDPRYLPDTVHYRKIIPYFNDISMQRAYTDKSIYNSLFHGVEMPDTIVKNIAGYYYNGDKDQLITLEEAKRICEKEEHLIFKPSIYSGRGKRIAFFDRDKDNNVEALFSSFRQNFVVQRIVSQHPDLAKINPTSLNTIRVVSFRFENQIHILSTILRMGGPGSRIDNISAGGISCVIQPDGRLAEKAVTRKAVWTEKHPNGMEFKDITVPNLQGVLDSAKQLHLMLPYFDFIGWDFAVRDDGAPVFIEFNVMPEPNQVSCGPTFGGLTDKVLEDVFLNKQKGRSSTNLPLFRQIERIFGI